MVISEIDCCKTTWNKEKISFRKINKMDYESFHSDILSLDLIKKPEKDLSALCQQYDSVLYFRQTRSCKYKDSAQKTTNTLNDSGNIEG